MVKIRTLFLLVCLLAVLSTLAGCSAKESQSGGSLDNGDGSITPLAENTGKIIVTLKDEETGKPIGKVYEGYPSVVLDGQDRGYVTDYGQIAIVGLSAGTHLLKIVVPTYGEMNRYVELDPGEQADVAVQINMPNPVFDVSIESATGGGLLDEVGTVKVTLTNIGNVDARSPTAKVLIYTKDGNGNISAQPIATRTLRFSTLSPTAQGGGSQTMTCSIPEYVWGVKEVVVVAVYDTWDWTPEHANPGWRIDAPDTVLDRLTESVVSYLENNPDVLIGTLTKLAGWDSD